MQCRIYCGIANTREEACKKAVAVFRINRPDLFELAVVATIEKEEVLDFGAERK